MSVHSLSSSFRDARSAGPESITTIVSMDSQMCNCTSKLAPRGAPRNEGEGVRPAMSFITGVGLTSYGKHAGSSSLD